jgi:aminoglycoside phosphotransferase (APT) family kinase protein
MDHYRSPIATSRRPRPFTITDQATIPLMPRWLPEDVVRMIAQHLELGSAARVAPTWRSWRWMVDCPGDRIAWIAEDDQGWDRLRREGEFIATLAAAGCRVPRVIGVDEVARLQVRSKLLGISGYAIERLVFGGSGRVPSAARYLDNSPLTKAGRVLAGDLGAEIAALHRAPGEEARTLGLPSTSYLTTLDQIDRRLECSAGLRDFRTAVIRLRDWFAALPDDPVIALGDIQMHNMVVDAATGALAGVFDFDDAAVAHRLEDFKYLPSFGVAFTRVALEAYSAAGGPAVGLDAVGRFHVLSALEHFTFVDDASPRWTEIIEWSHTAIDRFLDTIDGGE